MKCEKCGKTNIHTANYCVKCCYKFSEEERKTAKKKSIIGMIETIENLDAMTSLSIFLDHIIVKIVIIVFLFGVGLFYSWKNGINLKIVESNSYHIQYNQEANEYYLLVETEETPLNLFIPNRVQEFTIQHWDSDHNLIDEKKYDSNDSVILKNNSQDDYYTIEASYNNTNIDRIKMYIFLEK